MLNFKGTYTLFVMWQYFSCLSNKVFKKKLDKILANFLDFDLEALHKLFIIIFFFDLILIENARNYLKS